MSGKRGAIGGRPASPREVEGWVRGADSGQAFAGPRAEVFAARLTLDITPALRGRIKVAAFRQGVTVANMLRTLLEREFSDSGTGA